MNTKILDGKQVSKKILKNLSERIRKLIDIGIKPKLTTLICNSDESILSYVRSQRRMAEKLGILFDEIHIKPGELKNKIIKLNDDNDIHGIMITQPLPKEVDSCEILSSIDPEKDVEGVSPLSLGKLLMGKPVFAPCTAEAAVRMLIEYGYNLKGKDSVIIGRSTTVGKPLALLLLLKKYNSTVTVCHTGTSDISKYTSKADYVFVAAGKPGLLKKEMVTEKTVVVDIGINFVGGKLVGDADFDGLNGFVSAITPVPGGVGSVTTSILMEHVVMSAERKIKKW